jgi:menaquinone-dependent protoporphyrinogen oxidase
MARILILYATIEGHTARVAERIALGLRRSGHAVDVREARARPDLLQYCGVIVGASVHYGRHPGWLRAWLRESRTVLAARPGAFFSVCLSAKPRYAQKLLRQAGWRPQLTATFTGALQYSKYGAFKRALMVAFAAFGGHNTDTSRDHDYTDWHAVERFSEAFARLFSADLPHNRALSSRAG